MTDSVDPLEEPLEQDRDPRAPHDPDVNEALVDSAEADRHAAEFAATLPSDPEAEVDADAVAEHQTAIQDAATAASSACAAE